MQQIAMWQNSEVMTHLVRSVAVLEEYRTCDGDDWSLWLTDGPKWAAQTPVPDFSALHLLEVAFISVHTQEERCKRYESMWFGQVA